MNFKGCSLLCALVALLMASNVYAVPKMETEPLPLENDLMIEFAKTEEGKAAFAYILSLNTFQDHSDKTKYYYSPTFRISSNPAGAATVIVNDSAIARRSQIYNLEAQLNSLNSEDFLTLKVAYNKLTAKLGDSTLTETERKAIDLARANIKKEFDALLLLADKNEGELPFYVKNSLLNQIGNLLAFSGFPVESSVLQSNNELFKVYSKLSNSNGGLFTGNVVSGFSPTELGYMRIYKQKRAELGLPQVNLAVLPINNIEFFSLAETYINSYGRDAVGVPLFRTMNGTGSASAGTFNFDLTLDGADKFSKVPPPIVVPVGIKATMTVKPPTFRAKFSCDFTTGWSLQGRTDVKDGMIIYNNDIYSTMVAKSIAETDKPCKIETSGGTGSDQEMAYTAALRRLQDRFENLFFERVSLSKQEKETYWNKVQQDIAANRSKGANSGWAATFANARRLGWIGTIIGAFSNASRFYWHTNVQNITSLDKVKFEEEIVVDQNQSMTLALGTADMCLAWNTKLKRYLACSKDEALVAQSVSDAASEAAASCGPNDTTPECSKDREVNAPQDANGNVTTTNPPTTIPETLPDTI